MLIDTVRYRIDQNDDNFIQNINGILMLYDKNRSKWLSVSRDSVVFGIDGDKIASDRWLMHNKMWSNLQGYHLNRNATITLISARTKNISDCKFKIIGSSDNDSDNICLIELNDESRKINDNVNFDVNKGDSIQVLLKVMKNKVDYPSLLIEYAWR